MMWYYALYMDGKQYTLAMVVPGMIKNIFSCSPLSPYCWRCFWA